MLSRRLKTNALAGQESADSVYAARQAIKQASHCQEAELSGFACPASGVIDDAIQSDRLVVFPVLFFVALRQERQRTRLGCGIIRTEQPAIGDGKPSYSIWLKFAFLFILIRE